MIRVDNHGTTEIRLSNPKSRTKRVLVSSSLDAPWDIQFDRNTTIATRGALSRAELGSLAALIKKVRFFDLPSLLDKHISTASDTWIFDITVNHQRARVVSMCKSWWAVDESLSAEGLRLGAIWEHLRKLLNLDESELFAGTTSDEAEEGTVQCWEPIQLGWPVIDTKS